MVTTLKKRAQLFHNIRAYFNEEAILEVDTSLLSQFGNPDPALLNFVTLFNGPGALYKKNLYLITSPEYHMKRLLSEGSGSIYYLGKVFRDGELSRRHNPEFTILEWYRVDYDLNRLINEVVQLIQKLSNTIAPIKRYTYKEVFELILGIDPFNTKLTDLIQLIDHCGIELTFSLQTKDEALDLLMTHKIEIAFDPEEITVISYYPSSQASLAKIINDGGNAVGKRFEVYWKGLELANGYEELTDSIEQRERFLSENSQRERYGMKAVPFDTFLLDTLDHLPFCSGVALGVDRLFMAIEGIDDIKYALPFGIEKS